MTEWFTRPVLHVADVAASVAFFVEKLGFSSPWHYDEDGKPVVAQVERQGCAAILSSQWPAKRGTAMLFVSLTAIENTPESQTIALDQLRAELGANVAIREADWGYRCLVIDDPDGNQIYFNYPD
ncbi:MAG: glyoxalase superfamily protein [Kofleriaceae bacterium]